MSGKKSDVFHGVVSRFSYLCQFTPAFLQTLTFTSETASENSCLEALALLKELNASKKRTLPADAPTAFVPKKLLPLIRDRDGKLKKSAWECALLTQLKEEIRAGNLSVAHSKRFGHFDDFFIPAEQWERLREGFFQRAGLPQNPAEVTGYLHRRLNEAYDRFLQTAPANRYATADKSGWHFAADPSEKLDLAGQRQLDELKDWVRSQ